MGNQNRPYLNGACYVYEYTKHAVPVEKASELLNALNVKSVRSWNHIAWLLKSPTEVNRELCDEFHRLNEALKSAGVEQVIGMSHTWFFPNGCDNSKGGAFSVPSRNLSQGSDYLKFLQMFEISWETLAREFPEINFWETGNEHNHDPFLHPLNYFEDTENNVFTLKEKAEITTDLMYYSAKGIRKANPHAVIIMPGMAPIGEHGLGVVADNVRVEYGGMVTFLEYIYEMIGSGEYGSTDSRDFFDALSWHPYYATQQEDGSWKWEKPNDTWVSVNNMVYDVARKNGDDGIDCYFSEYGFNDFGSEKLDEELSEYVICALDMIREKLPYVASVSAYRMFEMLDIPDAIDSYAFFHLDEKGKLIPKKRAYALQKAYGGVGKLAE